MTGNYILDEHNQPVKCTDVYYWAKWIEAFDRQLLRTDVDTRVVSTVFLGLAEGFGLQGEPFLWETKVFDAQGDECPNFRRLYSSKEAAAIGHLDIFKLLFSQRRNQDDDYDIAAIIPFDRDFKY